MPEPTTVSKTNDHPDFVSLASSKNTKAIKTHGMEIDTLEMDALQYLQILFVEANSMRGVFLAPSLKKKKKKINTTQKLPG